MDDAPRDPGPKPDASAIMRPGASRGTSPAPAASRGLPGLMGLGVAVVLFRVFVEPHVYLEMDSAIYLRAAEDYARHLLAGDFWTRPWDGSTYAAVEYWPFLYPLLAGAVKAVLGVEVETAARLVSIGAGILAIVPAGLLARRFWGDEAGLVAAALVGFDPGLGWHCGVARTEGLYLLLLLGGIALALGAAWTPTAQSTGAAALAGLLLALAYMTRFETLVIAPFVLLAMVRVGWSRAPRLRLGLLVAVLAGTFALTAAPYARLLTRLNGGAFTPVSAQKARSDALEGISTAVEGHRVDAFTAEYGPPGLGRVPDDDPWARRVLRPESDELRRLFWHSLGRVPANVLLATQNAWGPVLLLALLALLLDGRDPRVQALGLLLLPVPLIAFTASWDPAPRYFAFASPVLDLLATCAAVRLWRGSVAVERRHARLLMAGLFVAVLAAWYVPDPLRTELNTGTAFESHLRDALAGGEGVKWIILGVALAIGFVLPPRWAAPVIAAQGIWIVVRHLEPLPWLSNRWEALCVPATLVAMAVAAAVAWLTLPWPIAPGGSGARESLGRKEWRVLLRWLAAWTLVLALQQAHGRDMLDQAYRRAHVSDPVAAFLRTQAKWVSVMAGSPVDVIRARQGWTPIPSGGWPAVPGEMARRHADAVVLKVRTHPLPGGGEVDAPPAELDLVRAFPWPVSEGETWEWRVYRLAHRPASSPAPAPR